MTTHFGVTHCKPFRTPFDICFTTICVMRSKICWGPCLCCLISLHHNLRQTPLFIYILPSISEPLSFFISSTPHKQKVNYTHCRVFPFFSNPSQVLDFETPFDRPHLSDYPINHSRCLSLSRFKELLHRPCRRSNVFPRVPHPLSVLGYPTLRWSAFLPPQ